MNYTNKNIIVITGVSATGKTTFGTWLSKKLIIPFISKDKIKEQIYYSLNANLEYEQKRKIGQASYAVMYGFMEELMKNNCSFIIESNFKIEANEIIKSCQRHNGLLANGKYDDFNKFLEVPKKADEFHFYKNDIVVIDTTCLENVSYNQILAKIKDLGVNI